MGSPPVGNPSDAVAVTASIYQSAPSVERVLS